jgi:hypothetical protein
VEAKLPKWPASTRATPLAVPHPVHVVHRVVVRADRPFRLSGSREIVTDDAFEFSCDRVVEGREMRLAFDYRSRADFVAPGKIKAHQQAVEKMKEELGFVLASDLTEARVSGSAAPWPPLAILGLLVAVAAATLAARARRAHRRPTPGEQDGSPSA